MDANIRIFRYARKGSGVVIPNEVRNLWENGWMPDQVGMTNS